MDILDEKLVAIALCRIEKRISPIRGDQIQYGFLDVQNDHFFSAILHAEVSRCNRVV